MVVLTSCSFTLLLLTAFWNDWLQNKPLCSSSLQTEKLKPVQVNSIFKLFLIWFCPSKAICQLMPSRWYWFIPVIGCLECSVGAAGTAACQWPFRAVKRQSHKGWAMSPPSSDQANPWLAKQTQTRHCSLPEIKTFANGEIEPSVEKWHSETAARCIKALIHHSCGVTGCQVKETGGIYVVWKCHPSSNLLFSAEQKPTLPTKPPCFVYQSETCIIFLYCFAFEEEWGVNKIPSCRVTTVHFLLTSSWNGEVSSDELKEATAGLNYLPPLVQQGTDTVD